MIPPKNDQIRSAIMRAVKSTGTKPEILVRKFVHSLGYRFRLHRKSLPGTPDLVFPRLRKVIFVNGCFWHGHDCLSGDRVPKSNTEYWLAKIARNRQRDQENSSLLTERGWSVYVVWECKVKTHEGNAALAAFLQDDYRPRE